MIFTKTDSKVDPFPSLGIFEATAVWKGPRNEKIFPHFRISVPPSGTPQSVENTPWWACMHWATDCSSGETLHEKRDSLSLFETRNFTHGFPLRHIWPGISGTSKNLCRASERGRLSPLLGNVWSHGCMKSTQKWKDSPPFQNLGSSIIRRCSVYGQHFMPG